MRQARRDADEARKVYERVRADLDRAEERVNNAFRLWEDAK